MAGTIIGGLKAAAKDPRRGDVSGCLAGVPHNCTEAISVGLFFRLHGL
jgi:hypothetical protein